MRKGFLNQKLGKRMSRKAQLQKFKLDARRPPAPRQVAGKAGPRRAD